ncbi:hypothetical protein [Paenibacillus popilliae]|uniref:Uncharacterized protein n=1 Tax=Paenibacillus popilliae TaxID=78057 RepID=A0ABY3ATJ7_PAEPP|nr:hypothetical protein [Paenibacillus sp. SDF0028]TQR46030.1 hypothetical protein C7Y44_10095 [Paenibacillus sp. SDF0028]
MYFRFMMALVLIITLLIGCSSTKMDDSKRKDSLSQSEDQKLTFDPNIKPAVLIKVEDYNDDAEKVEIAKSLVITLEAVISGIKGNLLQIS